MKLNSKKIKEEFGFDDESKAVQEYASLNNDFMSSNYPLIACQIIARLNLDRVNILDIGTGLGSLACEFASRLPEAEVFGIDISQEMLDKAKQAALEKKLKNLIFSISDACKLEFKDNFFDVVTSFGVLHHIRDLPLVFTEVKRVLKDKGVAFIYDLRRDSPEHLLQEISLSMSVLHKKAFLESVREAYDYSYIENLLSNLDLSEYYLSCPDFSRETIIKNKDLLRKSALLGKRFNKILLEIYFKK